MSAEKGQGLKHNMIVTFDPPDGAFCMGTFWGPVVSKCIAASTNAAMHHFSPLGLGRLVLLAKEEEGPSRLSKRQLLGWGVFLPMELVKAPLMLKSKKQVSPSRQHRFQGRPRFFQQDNKPQSVPPFQTHSPLKLHGALWSTTIETLGYKGTEVSHEARKDRFPQLVSDDGTLHGKICHVFQASNSVYFYRKHDVYQREH